MKIGSISNATAKIFFDKYTQYREPFTFAICVESEDSVCHGVIALNADGTEFSLGHLWTDANAQVGSLLYGAAWRAAKAMGYTHIKI